jgi:hypothetical protein
VVLAVGAGNFRPSFVEHTGQDNEAAEAGAHTAWGVFGEVGSIHREPETVQFCEIPLS